MWQRGMPPPKLPRDSRALMRSVSQRFPSGISVTGREACTIASVVATEMVLPLPFHSCLLSFCHVVHLLYAVDLQVSNSLWRAVGATHTFLVHVIAEFTECGSTNTLYFHGLSHVWFGDRLPIQFGDEAREADLCMAKRFAPVTSTDAAASIEDSWKHEMYNRFFKGKRRCMVVAFWQPVRRPIVFEKCVIGCIETRRRIFLRLLNVLVQVPECTLLMHSATCSVRVGYNGATQDASDVYCICGSCGSIRSGPRQWVPLDVSRVTAWPTLGLQSLRVYKPPKKRKGKKDLERPRAPLFAPVSVEIVADPNLVDLDASFPAEVADAPSPVQPVRAAKLRRVHIVEALDWDVTGQASSSSSSSGDTDSVSDSDRGSDSPGSAGSGDSSAATSSAVDVSSDCSTSTSSSETETAPAAPPPTKKFRHTAMPAGSNTT